MRTAIGSLLLGLAAGVGACVIDVPELTTSTSSTGGPDDGSSGADTSSSPSPTSDGGSTGDDPTAADTGEDSTGSTGDPDAACQVPLPAPTDCEPVPEACAGATPLARAADGAVGGVARTADDVWFTASRAGCYALYRVSKQGGDAVWVRSMDDVTAYEADDEAVYLVVRTADPFTTELHALVDGVETVIGETHGDPREETYFSTSLHRASAGVVAYHGGYLSSYLHLTPTKAIPLAQKVDGMGAIRGSRPEFDGEHLHFAWSDGSFDPEMAGPLDRKLVRLVGDTSVLLADNASTRGDPSVALDQDFVYFATGDPTSFSGEQKLPMNVSRVPRAGGPPEPLFPPMNIYVDQVLVADGEVFFHEAPSDIFAVPTTGGPLRHVWHGVENGWLTLDERALYFAVGVPVGDIPEPGTTFIVRLDRDAALP